jgi:hypothetical protein
MSLLRSFFSGKGLRIVVDLLVPSPMSSVELIRIKVFRSALLPVKTETPGHMCVSLLRLSQSATVLKEP